MDRTRPEPLIFVAWMDTLNRKLLSDELGELFGEFRKPDPRRLVRILEQAPAFCDDVDTRDLTETCPDQVRIALEQALTDLADAYGNDLESWAWGDAHRAKLPHPALSRIPVLGGLFTNPIATSGGDETVNRGGARYSGDSPRERYSHVHGPGLRALHDLSKPPASSRFMIADGQSGNPLSPHYAGMARAWRGGRYVKLVGETQEDAEILRLTPAAR
jgi:penicillin amidase